MLAKRAVLNHQTCFEAISIESQARSPMDGLRRDLVAVVYCFEACAWAWLVALRTICVPLSRCTFWLVEVINDPCAPPAATEARFSPFRPKTPWLLEVNCPAAFKPPTVPRAAPAAFAVEPTAPFAALPTFAAGLATDPTAPPAVELTPPSALAPPDLRPDAMLPPAAPPLSPRSSAPAELDAIVEAVAKA
jgi:hypothetical protein